MQEPPRTEPPPDEGVAAAATPDAHATQFRCPNCAAPMVWDPERDALRCDHCGHDLKVPRSEGTILERPLEEAGTAARGFGIATRTARCTSCGAKTAFSGQDTSTACAFCGSAVVLESESYRNALRPESLIPLEVGSARVDQAFRAWLGTLWFRPTALRTARRDNARGVYVPVWTFDGRVASDWSADAGFYYTVMELRPVMVNGKLQIRSVPVQKVRWEPAWGKRADAYDDLPVHASKGLSEKLRAELGGYDMKELVPWRPEYLAGWQAEEYAVDLESAWDTARGRIEASQAQRCAGDVPGDTQRNLRVHNLISDVRWKLVLLPVWTLTYTFGGKPYAVLVHGQSGKVVGDAPYSWVKIALLVVAIGVLALFLLALLSL